MGFEDEFSFNLPGFDFKEIEADEPSSDVLMRIDEYLNRDIEEIELFTDRLKSIKKKLEAKKVNEK